MKREFKAAWVAALRSGGFKRVTGQLRCRLGHCCLGVALEVGPKLDPNFPVKQFHGPDGYEVLPLWDESEEPMRINGYLPDSLCDYIGLPVAQMSRLGAMNDNENTPFPQIADWIEVNVVEEGDDNVGSGDTPSVG